MTLRVFLIIIVLMHSDTSKGGPIQRFSSTCSVSLCTSSNQNSATGNCSSSLTCYNFLTSSSQTFCAPRIDCSLFDPCIADANQCPSNMSVCIVNSCCPSSICLPLALTFLCMDNQSTSADSSDTMSTTATSPAVGSTMASSTMPSITALLTSRFSNTFPPTMMSGMTSQVLSSGVSSDATALNTLPPTMMSSMTSQVLSSGVSSGATAFNTFSPTMMSGMTSQVPSNAASSGPAALNTLPPTMMSGMTSQVLSGGASSGPAASNTLSQTMISGMTSQVPSVTASANRLTSIVPTIITSASGPACLWSQWANGQCSVTCGDGRYSRQRICRDLSLALCQTCARNDFINGSRPCFYPTCPQTSMINLPTTVST